MYKIGQSIDIHNLKKNIFHKKIMIIGGTTIDSKYRIQAHSDGDILLHSIAEAIYGALGIGDLGSYFLDKNKKNKNLCSSKILEHALYKMNDQNYEIVNIDFTLICEKVHFAKVKDKILRSLTRLLKTESINFKATRWENLSNKQIQCNAIVLLKPKDIKVKPLDKDRLISFISKTSDSLTENIINSKQEKNTKGNLLIKSTTQKINDFINGLENEEPQEEIKKIVEDKNTLQQNIKTKISGSIDENGFFKKIKKIRDENDIK